MERLLEEKCAYEQDLQMLGEHLAPRFLRYYIKLESPAQFKLDDYKIPKAWRNRDDLATLMLERVDRGNRTIRPRYNVPPALVPYFLYQLKKLNDTSTANQVAFHESGKSSVVKLFLDMDAPRESMGPVEEVLALLAVGLGKMMPPGISHDVFDAFVCDASNQTKFSVHIIYPHIIVRGSGTSGYGRTLRDVLSDLYDELPDKANFRQVRNAMDLGTPATQTRIRAVFSPKLQNDGIAIRPLRPVGFFRYDGYTYEKVTFSRPLRDISVICMYSIFCDQDQPCSRWRYDPEPVIEDDTVPMDADEDIDSMDISQRVDALWREEEDVYVSRYKLDTDPLLGPGEGSLKYWEPTEENVIKLRDRLQQIVDQTRNECSCDELQHSQARMAVCKELDRYFRPWCTSTMKRIVVCRPSRDKSYEMRSIQSLIFCTSRLRINLPVMKKTGRTSKIVLKEEHALVCWKEYAGAGAWKMECNAHPGPGEFDRDKSTKINNWCGFRYTEKEIYARRRDIDTDAEEAKLFRFHINMFLVVFGLVFYDKPDDPACGDVDENFGDYLKDPYRFFGRATKNLLKLFAIRYREPTLNIPKIIAFFGHQGSGKGTIINLLGRLFRDENYFAGMIKSLLHSDHNEYQENKCLIYFSECKIDNDEEMNILKEAANDTPLFINPKGITGYRTNKHQMIIIDSNLPNFLQLATHQRRFCYFECRSSLLNRRKFWKLFHKEFADSPLAKGPLDVLIFMLSDDKMPKYREGCVSYTKSEKEELLRAIPARTEAMTRNQAKNMTIVQKYILLALVQRRFGCITGGNKRRAENARRPKIARTRGDQVSPATEQDTSVAPLAIPACKNDHFHTCKLRGDQDDNIHWHRCIPRDRVLRDILSFARENSLQIFRNASRYGLTGESELANDLNRALGLTSKDDIASFSSVYHGRAKLRYLHIPKSGVLLRYIKNKYTMMYELYEEETRNIQQENAIIFTRTPEYQELSQEE